MGGALKLFHLTIVCVVCGPIYSCKTAAPAETNSEIRGGAAYDAVSDYMTANTDEEVIAAVTKRLEDLNRYTSMGEAANYNNCPVAADDPCSLVNIIIEFERPGSGSVGHTAVSISRTVPGEDVANRNDQFYDFGPGTDEMDGKKVKVGDPGIFSLPMGTFSGLFSGVPGTQWWDNQHRFKGNPHPSSIGIREIIENIDTLAGDYSIIRVPICTTRAHAELIARYWVKTYMDMPTYKIPGNHCTSMVAQSFESTLNASRRLEQSTLNWAAETLDRYVPNPREIKRWITSPAAYAERVLSGKYSGTLDYRHQCGTLKGKTPGAIMIKNYSIYDKKGIRDQVKWQPDRSLP